MQETSYRLKFIKAQNDNGIVWYTIQVFAERNQTWTFKARYSQMREIHDKCAQNKKFKLPQFPHRKIFGSTKQDFIQRRRKQLQNYYSSLLSTTKIQNFPQLGALINTNRPKQQEKKSISRVDTEINMKLNQALNQKRIKQNYDEIVNRARDSMVMSNDIQDIFDNDCRKKFNEDFQSLKLHLRSKLLEQFSLPRGHLDNQSEFCSMFFHDQHGAQINKLHSLMAKIKEKQYQLNINFIINL